METTGWYHGTQRVTQGGRTVGLVPADAASRIVDSAGASPTEISSDG
ncbi:MAG: hypothetical protein ACK526_08165 [Planctomyces sp.]